MINITINNKKYDINKKYNILQVCELFNITIPKFCYHEKLSIAGNCRMCLIEVKGVLKPIASCALPVANNMVIFTNSKLVKKAREGILEFILLNHPLDCPICDQGGECDLQDQTLLYGNDKGRFYEYKRAVSDKNCGTLIKTVMTRCIQCTRCVRFLTEIAGLSKFGLINRGSNMEVSMFLNKAINSEISGNVIDLCPVGALTSNPYSFIARPWELKSFNTIDLNDSLVVNIRVDLRDMNILRIIPRYNKNLNDFWISDISRFSFDGLKMNRILYPILKTEATVLSISWFNVIYLLKKKVLQKKLNFIVGNFLDLESIFLLKKVTTKVGNFSILANVNSNTKAISNCDFRDFFLCNLNISELKFFQTIILIGTNLRFENPIINIFIHNYVKKNNLFILTLGSSFGYNYRTFNFGNNIEELVKIIEGKSFLNNRLVTQKSLVLFGQGLLLQTNYNINKLMNLIKKKQIIAKVLNNLNSCNLINELNLSNSLVKFNDYSFQKNLNVKDFDSNNCLYLLNTDSIFFNKLNVTNIIYQGHHNMQVSGLKNSGQQCLILPTLTFFEKAGIFINFLGIYQKTKLILMPPVFARNDWIIFNIIYVLKFRKNAFTNISDVRSAIFNNFNISLNNNANNLQKFINIKGLKIYFVKINNVLLLNYLTNVSKANQLLKASRTLKMNFNSLKLYYSNFI